MRNAAAIRWIVGAVFVSLIIAALAYFLVISPTLDATSEARERAESEQARIDQLEIQLAGLRADFARLDEFKAELAEYRVELPTEVLLNELTRQLEGHAAQTDVVLTGMTTSTPYQVLPPRAMVEPPPPPPTDDAEGEGGEGDATDAPAPPPEPAGPTLPDGFYAVPVQLTTVGSYEDTLAFIDRLQRENDRLLFVNDLQATALEQEGAQGGRPATEDGFLESTISFIGYVLLDADGLITAPDGEVVDPGPVELPSGGGNPFEPLN